ncbi:ADP-ribosylglycohydrolase family protein [Plebeiibacterium sediminum]|uniref:ADP-ribosylglycohydrolase family protein n=1 Tax=Plebeiibacterium sediminum TaxID=2992112 RepID=A0AAE3M0Q2_9BACT|nr:ADP-ribosylglycohydrolase family protein [Plebeiobacterium sediminum]MCW3784957.1 ADP-ribosylglycohydrolase family protein [Plebeiobacterium sediminum]
MKGAIIGDIIGSAFVHDNRSTTNFQLFKPISSFTEDTVLTIATADAVIHNNDFRESMRAWIQKYPYAGYTEKFKRWAMSDSDIPFNSKGNGSARRVSSIGMLADSLDEALLLTEKTAKVTHSDLDKINASKAVSAAIFLAKNGENKAYIKEYITNEFGYNLNKDVHELHFDVTSPDLDTPVPAAITMFLNSNNYEDAVRKAVSLGGHSNTIGSITGAIAYAYYKHIPKSIIKRALNRLTPEMERFINDFEDQYLHYNEENKEILISIH